MNRDTLKKLIAEEIARPEVQDSLTQAQQSWVERAAALLKHPVTLTVLGFLLTSLVGTFISQRVADRAQRDAELQAALLAVGEFASEASELRVQQSYLVEAMERGESDAVLEHVKERYDESYLSWNASRYRNYLTLRSFFGFTYDNFAEQLVSRTIHQEFRAYNSCLGQTYVQYSGSDGKMDAKTEMNNCLAERDRPGAATQSGRVDAVAVLNERIFQCSRRIFDTVHHFIALDLHCGKDIWHPETGGLTGIYDSVWAECGIGKKRALDTYARDFDAFCTKQEKDMSWWQ